ncbi:MAG: outer membrane protein assembly factor BamB [Burkholderiales bacterium]
MGRRAAWLLALLPALAGCFGGSGAGPQPAALAPLTSAHGPKLEWSADTGAAEDFVFGPAVVDDAVFVASRRGEVTRLDAATGRRRWHVSLDTKLSAGVGAGQDTVTVASDEGEVFALEAQSGKLRWRVRVSSEVLASPKIADGQVLVRSADSRIHALAVADGKRRWMYQRTPASLRLRTAQGLAVSEGQVYAGFSNGKLVALALDTGALRWEATVAVPKGSTELERVTDVVGDPAVPGREVCAVAYQGRVACYDTHGGSQLWARESSSVTGVSTDARYAYISDDQGVVQALDRSTGRSFWKQDRLARRRLSLPLPVGEVIVVGDFEGYVHLLSRDTGALVGRAKTDGSEIRAAPVSLPDGGFLVQTQDGGLFALRP